MLCSLHALENLYKYCVHYCVGVIMWVISAIVILHICKRVRVRRIGIKDCYKYSFLRNKKKKLKGVRGGRT